MLQRIKAAYVSSYLTLVSVISAYALWQLIQGQDLIAWGGVLLAAAPMALVIGFLMVKPVGWITPNNIRRRYQPSAKKTAKSP